MAEQEESIINVCKEWWLFVRVSATCSVYMFRYIVWTCRLPLQGNLLGSGGCWSCVWQTVRHLRRTVWWNLASQLWKLRRWNRTVPGYWQLRILKMALFRASAIGMLDSHMTSGRWMLATDVHCYIQSPCRWLCASDTSEHLITSYCKNPQDNHNLNRAERFYLYRTFHIIMLLFLFLCRK